MTEYVLFITLVALAAIAAFAYFRHRLESKMESAVAQTATQVVVEKEVKIEAPLCVSGVFPTVFTECHQEGAEVVILAKVESHISCPFPDILVDLDSCIIFRVLPETINRLDQVIAEVQMVPACPLLAKLLPELGAGERTLFAPNNYRPKAVSISKK